MVVQLHNDADSNIISGWTISTNSLLNIKDTEDKDNKRVFYLANKLGKKDALSGKDTIGTELSIAIGKITKSNLEKKDYSDAAFRVTEDGTLYASGARIKGDGSFSGSINAYEGRIGPFVVETSSKKENFKSVIYLGDEYSIAGDTYSSGAQQIGWPEYFNELAYSSNYEHPTYVKRSSPQAGFFSGTNKTDIQRYSSLNPYISLYWDKSANSGSGGYWYKTENGWTFNVSAKPFLRTLSDEEAGKLTFYNPDAHVLFYHNGDDWSAHVFTNGLPTTGVREKIKNRDIITIPYSFNTKPSRKMYYYPTTGWFYGIKDNVYTAYPTLASYFNEFGNQKTLYYLEHYNLIYVYDEDTEEWKFYNSSTWQGSLIAGKRRRLEKIHVLSAEPKGNNIPTDDLIIWHDSTSFSSEGYWYQDLSIDNGKKEDGGSWIFCNNAAQILDEVGVKGLEYYVESANKIYFYWDKIKGKWWHKSGRGTEPLCRVLKNPDEIATSSTSALVGKGFCHSLFQASPIFSYYTAVRASSSWVKWKETCHTSAVSFLKDLKNPVRNNKNYFTNQSTGAAYYCKIVDGVETWNGIVNNYEDMCPYIKNNFYYLLKNQSAKMSTEERQKVTHIIVGGGWNDRAIAGNDSLIRNAIAHFQEKAIELFSNAKIYIIGMGQSNISTAANKIMENTFKSYAEATKNLAKTNFYDISTSWGKADRFGSSVYQTNNVYPNRKGSENIAQAFNNAFVGAEGKIYVIASKETVDNKIQIHSSGLSVEDTNLSSVALWAGYAGEYNSPMEDKKYASDGLWSDRTPFYVTHGGKLHATGAIIEGEITATKGTIGKCKINEEGKLIVPGAQIEDLQVTEASITKLSVDKLYYNGEDCDNYVKFTNIEASGGLIGNWKISEGALSYSKQGEYLSATKVSPEQLGIAGYGIPVKNTEVIPNTDITKFEAQATLQQIELPFYVTGTYDFKGPKDYNFSDKRKMVVPALCFTHIPERGLPTLTVFFNSDVGTFLWQQTGDPNNPQYTNLIRLV